MEVLVEAAKYDPVSSPFNVQHQVHVDFDSETGFSGLPVEWQNLIKSALSKKEVEQNPKDAVAAVEFYDKYLQATEPVVGAKNPTPIHKQVWINTTKLTMWLALMQELEKDNS